MIKHVGWMGVFGAVAGLALVACGNSGGKGGTGTAGAGGGTAGATGGAGGGGNVDAGCAVSPTVLASGQSSPTSIVSDGTHVYWTNTGTVRSVMKVPVTGGTPVAVATGLRQPGYLAVDATNAYWTDQATTFPDGTILMSAPLDGSAGVDGGAPTVLVASAIALLQFVVAGGNIYYFNGSTLTVITTAGAAVRTLTPSSTNAVNATADAANLYWTNNVQQVLMMPFSGTTATVLTTLVAPGDFLGNSQPISVDATGVYVPANPGAGVDAVLSIPLAGGTATTVATFASAFNGVPGIVSDGKNVYWANNFGFAVMRAPVTGGAAVTISCDVEKPQGIAQDATHVYWTTEGGSVKALSK
jgi:hypothetical protein